MVFKDRAAKLISFSRMTKDEYIPSEEDPDKIMSDIVPVALNIVQTHLSSSTFCDRFLTPLPSMARLVRFSYMELSSETLGHSSKDILNKWTNVGIDKMSILLLIRLLI